MGSCGRGCSVCRVRRAHSPWGSGRRRGHAGNRRRGVGRGRSSTIVRGYGYSFARTKAPGRRNTTSTSTAATPTRRFQKPFRRQQQPHTHMYRCLHLNSKYHHHDNGKNLVRIRTHHHHHHHLIPPAGLPSPPQQQQRPHSQRVRALHFRSPPRADCACLCPTDLVGRGNCLRPQPWDNSMTHYVLAKGPFSKGTSA